MLERLDWTERLTLALTVIFVVTLALTLRVGGSFAWLVWGTLWVLVAGSALVLVNRSRPASDG